MAPSRRKGSSKAAAAAACCQWKIGDLVLAKLKGFPAWPATVSEPEKWGYKADLKKVLVHFFGTQQIAFCNPVDVEAFTEEKKQSLVKRHGKGADFVRAVREIVDSYERLKKEKETQHHEASCGDVADANVSNPVESFVEDPTDALELALSLPKKTSDSVSNRQETECATENDSAHNKEASLEDPCNNVSALKSPKPVANSSRKRSTDNLCSQGCVTNRNTLVRRSRSTSRVQNFVMPCIDGGKVVNNLSGNAAQRAYVRRNKCIRKSPDLSGCVDFGSPAFVSNGSMVDNGSEILTIDSDAFSLNEGSTIDSNFKHEDTIGCLEEVELNKGLDVEIKSVVNKKKRKPSRKRASHDVAKPVNKQEEETPVQNPGPSSQNICGNSEGNFVEHGGDEHLPLLKRLRVRMGQSLSTEAEVNNFVQAQERSCNENINSPAHIITSSNCESGSSMGDESSLLNGASGSVFPSKNLAPPLVTQIPNTEKDQTFISMDDEAALPPSKRLHRALEAMSANAAEEFQSHMEATPCMMTSSDKCCISTVKKCPCMAIDNQEGNGLEPQGLDNCATDPSSINVCSFSTSSNPMISVDNRSFIQVDKQLTMFQEHNIGNDVLSGVTDQVGEDHSDNAICVTAKTDLKIQLHGHISPSLGLNCCEGGSNQNSPDPSLLPNNEDNTRAHNHSNTAFNASEHNGISLDPVVARVNNDALVPNNIDAPPKKVVVCEDTEFLNLAAVDSGKSNDMSVVVKEIKSEGPEGDMNSVSTSDDLGEKAILGTRSSPSLTDGGDCIPHGSPPNTSVCNVSTSDSSNILHNGSCSPDVYPKQTLSGPGPIDGSKDGFVATQQSRSLGKTTDAGRAALLYFEAMLGTLTRTKESIGRATRIAIDCAKFGIAAKVMEILAQNLETESSLNRRVGLFFLVDSIAQSSRGLKGDVCGVYPSAIQAVLPRLLSAAAPPGNTAPENRRQCLKASLWSFMFIEVLRVWLERRILPESIVRRHIRELDSYSKLASACVHSRRTSRTERPLDDPIREMEGMLVDEYGSNSSFQLPGFCMPRMRKDEDEGSDSDGGNFEAVTPEHYSEVCDVSSTKEKHRHILEDVDGELEMEDVAPSCDVEMNSIQNVNGGNASQFLESLPLSFAPLPQDVQPSPPPAPSSSPMPPPPPPPPPPMPHLMTSASDPYHTVMNSKGYTDSQTVKDKPLHSVAQPLTAPSRSQPISDAVHYQVPECREMQLHMPESNSSFNSFPVLPDNFRHSDGVTRHNNKGYSLRPPHRVPSNQFSFVHREQHVKHRREVQPPPPPPPPPLYSNRHHLVQNMEREYFYNNHERSKPPPYDHRERWNTPAPYSDHRYRDRGLPAPYGCHPCESTRLPRHGWRFPPQSMDHRNSMPLRPPPFDDAIPVANRCPNFWGPT
ncbi:hypothetical protein Lal_00047413 [Lupinus albus]|nr:hypothetical protein Lal_00047413 [Lupinus albus]